MGKGYVVHSSNHTICVFCILGHLPVITTHPMDTVVLLHYGNKSAVLSCEANGGSDIVQYTWFAVTGNGSKMMLGETSNKLVLSPVTVEMNNTQYYCVATNNSGEVTSNSGYLTINGKMMFIQNQHASTNVMIS